MLDVCLVNCWMSSLVGVISNGATYVGCMPCQLLDVISRRSHFQRSYICWMYALSTAGCHLSSESFPTELHMLDVCLVNCWMSSLVGVISNGATYVGCMPCQLLDVISRRSHFQRSYICWMYALSTAGCHLSSESFPTELHMLDVCLVNCWMSSLAGVFSNGATYVGCTPCQLLDIICRRRLF